MTRRALLAMLALTGPALGQQILFLQAGPAPDSIRVHLESAGKPAPWDDARVRTLFILGNDTRENRDRGGADAAGVVLLPAPPPGAAAVGLDLKPAIEEIDADGLRAFVKDHCEERLPASVKGRVKVLRVQSCKAILRSGDGGSAPAAAETTQQAEIALRMDPTRAKVGSDIAFSISIGGEDVEEVRITATSESTGKIQTIESRKEGSGLIHVAATGLWRVEFHRLAPAPAGSGADWSLTSATLVFQVPEPKP